MNNAVYGKAMENVRKHRIIKLVNNDKKNKLVSEPNYHTTKCFSENLLAIEMKKTSIKMNKHIFRINNIIIKQNINVGLLVQ